MGLSLIDQAPADLLACTTRTPTAAAACTKDSYIRGSGFVDRCPAGREKQGSFCYNNCPTDWQYG